MAKMKDWENDILEEVKAQQAIQREKRGTLLKDCDTLAIRVACDQAEDFDHGGGIDLQAPFPDDVTKWRDIAYIKYANEEQLAVLKERLSWKEIDLQIKAYTGPDKPRQRRVVVFHSKVLRHILTFLTGSNSHKYWRGIDWKKVIKVH